MTSTITVVIPSYNRAGFLPRAVASVLEQTRRPEEIIIVDDGSTDNTAEVVHGLPGPIRYLHQQNQGAASARNHGIREASGEYIALLDTDDIWLPPKLERQVGILDAHSEVGLVHTAARLIDAEGKPNGKIWGKNEYQGWVRDRLLFANGVNASSVLVRKTCFEGTTGGYDERFRLLENWELWLRISRRWKFAYLTAPLIEYRIHSGNSIADLERLQENFTRFHEKHVHSSQAELPRRLRRRVLARHNAALADAFTGQDDFRSAMRAFARSLRYQPAQPGVLYRLLRVTFADVLRKAEAAIR